MNDFNTKYIKLSSEYLEEKLNSVKVKDKGIYKLSGERKKSPIKRFVNSLFKS